MSTSAGTTTVLSSGALLGDFEIVGVGGMGGMGVVYRAKQRSLGRTVALKVIRDEIGEIPEYRQRFLREARLAASVNHPHVVPIFDVGEYDGRLVLAMQWIEGEDLRSALARAGRLSAERAVRIVCQLAGALDAVHTLAGLVHRDVKPSNVLIHDVAGEDHAYLTDFGVARRADSAGELTRTGWVVGTAGYLSPEQVRGSEPGARSDLYALGCLFFEAVTGAPPFQGDNEMALRWAHANDPRPLPSAVAPELGTAFDATVAVALAIDPAERFASGQAFAAALARGHGLATAGPIIPPHEPTAVGPSTPLPPAALQTPRPVQTLHPGYGYGTPAPAAHQSTRGGNPLALVLLAVVALAGIAAAALVAAGVFSKNGSNGSIASAAHTSPPAHRHTPRAGTVSSAHRARGRAVQQPASAPPQANTSSAAGGGAAAAGSGYALQDLPVQCGYGVAGSAGMTCTFANNAFYEYWKASGGNPTQVETINVWSALASTYYPLSCSPGDGVVDCTGQNSSGIALDARFTTQAVSLYTTPEAASYAASGKLGPEG